MLHTKLFYNMDDFKVLTIAADGGDDNDGGGGGGADDNQPGWKIKDGEGGEGDKDKEPEDKDGDGDKDKEPEDKDGDGDKDKEPEDKDGDGDKDKEPEDKDGDKDEDELAEGFGALDDKKNGWKKGLLGEDGKPAWDKAIAMMQKQRETIGKHGEEKSAPKDYSFSEDSKLGEKYAGRALKDVAGDKDTPSQEFTDLVDYAKEKNWTNKTFNDFVDFAYDRGGLKSDEQFLTEEVATLKKDWGDDFAKNLNTVETFFDNIYKNDAEKLKQAQIMGSSAEGAKFLLEMTKIAKQSSGMPDLNKSQSQEDSDILTPKQKQEQMTIKAQNDADSEEFKAAHDKLLKHNAAIMKRDEKE